MFPIMLTAIEERKKGKKGLGFVPFHFRALPRPQNSRAVRLLPPVPFLTPSPPRLASPRPRQGTAGLRRQAPAPRQRGSAASSRGAAHAAAAAVAAGAGGSAAAVQCPVDSPRDKGHCYCSRE